MSEEDPKIIVDDDWKSQVEQEKEKLQEEMDKTTSDPDAQPMPEASISTLVTTLAMQAGMSLGQFPDPSTGQPKLDKPVAKHFIDTLAMLEEKTKGNLEANEAKLLTETVHQLRMAFVTMPDKLPEAEPESDSKGESTIELP